MPSFYFTNEVGVMAKNEIAKRSSGITEEEWQLVNEFNREMVEDYLANQTHLSDKSLVAYESGLKIYFNWVRENLKNKNCIDIKKKEFKRYLNWLANRDMSESAIKFKKSSVSAFNKFIENYYEDEYPNFRNYVTSDMIVPKTGKVFDKVPLTPEEIDYLCKELAKMGEWQKLAYVKFTYSTGCRRAESLQLLKEVVDYKPNVKEVTLYDEDGKEYTAQTKAYRTHDIRCKGRSKAGKVRKFLFGQDAMESIQKWLEVRGEDDCPYVFVIKNKEGTHQVSEQTLNEWCAGLFTDIVGRRVNCHLFRSSRATNLVVHEHRDLETAQKLLGHESSETTKIYVVREDEEDAFEAFVDD